MSANGRRGRGRGRLNSTSLQEAYVGNDTTSLLQHVNALHLNDAVNIVSENRTNLQLTNAVESTNSIHSIISLKRKFPRGKVGRRIPLYTNYFKLLLGDKHKIVYQYDVQIRRLHSEYKINRDTARIIFWEAVEQYPNYFPDIPSLAYDDAHILFSLFPLPIGTTEKELEIKNQSLRAVAFALKIKLTSTFVMDPSVNNNSILLTQLFDSLLTQRARCPKMRISAKFHSCDHVIYLIPNGSDMKHNISAVAEAWEGFYGAVKMSGTNILYNCDVTTSAFAKQKLNLVDLYINVLKNAGNFINLNELRNPQKAKNLGIREQDRNKLKELLNGLYLSVQYGSNQNSRRYKFVDIRRPACYERFLLNHPNFGEMLITVAEYFYKFKNIELKFPNFPVVQVGPSNRKIYIPMELLMLSTTPQKIKRLLTVFERSNLVKVSAYPPSEHMQKVRSFVSSQDLNQCCFLQKYGVQLDPEFLKLEGRVLPPLDMTTEQNELGKYNCIHVVDGSWGNLSNKFIDGQRRIAFSVIDVNCHVSQKSVEYLLRNLFATCEQCGMNFVSHDYLFDHWDPKGVNIDLEDLTNLRQTVKHFKAATAKEFPAAKILILFLLPKKGLSVYNIIKKVCDIEESVPSQCMVSSTFEKIISSNRRISAEAYNVCLKINAKMGGVNSKIYPCFEWLKKFVDPDSPTLHVGVDVTHILGKISISAVVANLDIEASRYGASIRIQPAGREKLISLGDALGERILAFMRVSKCKPEHVIIYRDGVSESEFVEVVREELGSAESVFTKLDFTCKPTISYVIVQKRHKTRFFVQNKCDGVGRLGNIPPGTVVDDCIVSNTFFDFFLASHFGGLGTTKPCRCYVLYDSWNCTADEWQQLIFAMCHLCCRCQKAISLPAPICYAHLACARAAAHCKALGNDATTEDLTVPSGSSDMYFV